MKCDETPGINSLDPLVRLHGLWELWLCSPSARECSALRDQVFEKDIFHFEAFESP